MSKRDLALGGISLAIAAAVWVATADYPTPADISRGLGPAFMPRLLAVLIAFLGVIVILRGWRSPGDTGVLLPSKMPAALLGVMVAYGVVLVPVGFAISTPIFLLTSTSMLGVKLRKSIVFALIVTVVAYIVFKVMLRVPLPTGELLGDF